MMNRRLSRKVGLITGAARGIGRECARRFAEEGATVIVTDIDESGAHEAALALGSPAQARKLDVRDEHDWAAVLAWVTETFGRLDILVNNAGVTGFHEPQGPQDPEHASLVSWRAVHAVNLEGVFLGCKYGIQSMKNNGGSIINISSRSGIVGVSRAAAYASSKAAVRNHTKSVALYCAEQGYAIRCNSVHPAVILTPMWDPMLGSGEERATALRSLANEIPLRSVGLPIDVAQAVVFLASDESRYLTGTEVHIDGGLLAGTTASVRRPE